VYTRALAALDAHVPMAGPLVIVSSNRSPNELDPARVRSGWLGIHVRFDLPGEPERAERWSMVEDWWCEAEFGAAARSMIGEAPGPLAHRIAQHPPRTEPTARRSRHD